MKRGLIPSMVNQLESAFDISAEADKAVSAPAVQRRILFSPRLKKNACDFIRP
jgi:hypothetical protein